MNDKSREGGRHGADNARFVGMTSSRTDTGCETGREKRAMNVLREGERRSGRSGIRIRARFYALEMLPKIPFLPGAELEASAPANRDPSQIASS
jgi:hypothetical protein